MAPREAFAAELLIQGSYKPGMKRLWTSFYPLMALTMLIWASTVTTSSILMRHGLTPLEVLFLASLCGLAVLLPAALTMPAARASFRQYRLRHLPILIICGLLGIVVYNLLLYSALDRNLGDVVGPTIVNYLWPIMTLIFAVPILKQPLTRRLVLATAVAFGGFMIIQTAKLTGGGAIWDASAQACLLALGAAISWGLFSALARRAADTHGFHPLSNLVIFQLVALAALLIAGGYKINFHILLSDPALLAALAVLGVGSDGVANMTWLQALRVGGAGRTSVVAYLTPVLSLTYVAIFLDQRPQWYALAGLAAILLAIFLVPKSPLPISPAQTQANLEPLRNKPPAKAVRPKRRLMKQR